MGDQATTITKSVMGLSTFCCKGHVEVVAMGCWHAARRAHANILGLLFSYPSVPAAIVQARGACTPPMQCEKCRWPSARRVSHGEPVECHYSSAGLPGNAVATSTVRDGKFGIFIYLYSVSMGLTIGKWRQHSNNCNFVAERR